MLYSFHKLKQMLLYHSGLYVLIILQLVIGVASIIYGSNIFYSVYSAEQKYNNGLADWVLEIQAENYSDDWQKLISTNDFIWLKQNTKPVLAIDSTQIWENADSELYNLLLLDADSFALQKNTYYISANNPYAHIVAEIAKKEPAEVLPLPATLATKRYINLGSYETLSQFIVKAVDFSDSAILAEEQELGSSLLIGFNRENNQSYTELRQKLWNHFAPLMQAEVELNLISPSSNFKTSSFYSKVLLNNLRVGAILALVVFLIGIMGIFHLLIAKRMKSIGISICCGATRKAVCTELIGECNLVVILGVILGQVLGTIATYAIDFGYMPMDTEQGIHYQSYLFTSISFLLILALLSSYIIWQIKKHKQVISLLKYLA